MKIRLCNYDNNDNLYKNNTEIATAIILIIIIIIKIII